MYFVITYKTIMQRLFSHTFLMQLGVASFDSIEETRKNY